MKPYIWLLGGAMVLSSCLTPVNPLVSHNNISRFDACVGQWRGEDASFTISKYRGNEVDLLIKFGSRSNACESDENIYYTKTK